MLIKQIFKNTPWFHSLLIMTYNYPFFINRESRFAEQNRTYYYKGDFKDILNIIEKTVENMQLVVRKRHTQNNFYQIVAQEKMKFISTIYPLNFEITVNKFEKFSLVKITAFSNMFAISQDSHSIKKADEFLFRIKNPNGTSQPIQQHVEHKNTKYYYSPKFEINYSKGSMDDFAALKKRYKNGEITKEEYKRLKKKIKN